MAAPTFRTKYISNGRATSSAYGYWWGWDSATTGEGSPLSFGNISDTTSFGSPDSTMDATGWPVGNGTQKIESLRYADNGTLAGFQTANTLQLEFYTSGTEVDTEYRWYSMKIGSQEFVRADATYNSTQQTFTWTGVTTNPFSSTTGSTHQVDFTRQELDPFSITDVVGPQANTTYTTVTEVTGWDQLETVTTGQVKSVFGIGNFSYIGFAVSNSNTVEPSTFSTSTGTPLTISSTNRYVWFKAIIDGTTTDNYYVFQIYPGSSNSNTSGGSGFYPYSDNFDLSLADYLVQAPTSINEGSAGTIVVQGENVPSATTLYWRVSPASEFDKSESSVSVTANTGSLAQIGSFTITPTADQTTEFQETGTVQLYQDSARTILLDEDDFIINDTSIDPGGGSDVWTTVITNGAAGTSSTYWGYNRLAGTTGDLSDTTADMYSGATCRRLGFTRTTGIDMIFDGNVTGGWNSVKIKGREYAYSDFTRTYLSSTNRTRFSRAENFNIFNTQEIVTVVFSTATAEPIYSLEVYPPNDTESAAFALGNRYNYLRTRGSRNSGSGTITVQPDGRRCTMLVWPQSEFALGFNVSYSLNVNTGQFSYTASHAFNFWIVYR